MDNLESNYIDISFALLKRLNRPLIFDVYVKRGENSFSKIFKKGDLLDFDRIRVYEEKGIDVFYVTEEEHSLYCIYVEKLGEVLNERAQSFKPNEAHEVLKELSQHTLKEIQETLEVSSASIKNAKNVVDGCIRRVSKDPKNVIKVMKLLSHQPYQLKHSVSVSMFAVLLAIADGMESDLNIQSVGLGGFFHDIGIGQLTFDPEDQKFLTAEQRKEMWRHPELGKEMLKQVKGIKSDVVQIVLQHHEQPNGHGYPNGLRGPEIYYPAKIVAIAYAFCSLISKKSYREAYPVSKAVEKLKEDHGKYDKKILETLTKLVLPNF
ncbi:HD domain-containing protein [Bacteriovoracaceae bacterium]|nr:HD domain-containing protein [Bacteriovoracaceae bacterium]